MTEHEIIQVLTPEVIATIIGLIILVGGATATAIIVGIRKYLIRGRDIANLLISALEDNKLTAAELKALWDALLKSLKENPEASKALLNSTKKE